MNAFTDAGNIAVVKTAMVLTTTRALEYTHSLSLFPSAHQVENLDEDTERKQLSLHQEERPQ